MNEYQVTFIYDLVNILTVVYAEDIEQAKRFAETQVLEVITDIGEPEEVTVTKTGEITNG